MHYMIKDFMKQYTLTTILAVVTLAVVAWVVAMIIRRRRSELLRGLAAYIDYIPLFAGLIGVAGSLTNVLSIYHAVTSIHASGIGDPRVVAAGFQEFFFSMTIIWGLFFIFLEAWLVVRMIYGRFLHELNTLPK